MRASKRTIGLFLALCLLTLSPALAQDDARAAWNSALDYVPQDAAMYVVVPSLDRLSQKVGAFNEMSGVNSPIAADLLSEFKRRIGMTEGVRDDAPMLLVLPEAPRGGEPGGSFLLVMPVSDYGAFIRDLGGTASGISEVNVENFRGYARSITGYAIMGQTEAAVKDYLPGRRSGLIRAALGQGGQQAMERSDLSIIINMDAMRPQLRGALQAANAQAAQTLEQASLDAAAARLAQSTMTLYNTVAQAVVDDAEMLLLGMDVGPDGFGMTMSMQFDPESETGAMFTDGGDSSDMLLRLPNRPYIAAMSVARGEVDYESIVDGLLGKLPAVADNGLGDLAKMRLPMTRQVERVAAAYYTPAPGASMLGASIFNGVILIDAADPETYQMAFRGYLEGLNNLAIPVAPAEGQNAAPANILFNTTYQENALNIDGVRVDQFTTRYALPQEAIQDAGQMGPMIMLLAGSGQTGYIAATEDYVIQTTVADPQLIKMAIDAARDGDGLGTSESISRVQLGAMTGNPTAQALLSVPGIMQTGRTLMSMMGGQGPDDEMFNVPAAMLPLSASLTVRQSNVSGRVSLPIENISFLNNLYQRFGAGMQGGAVDAGAGAEPMERQEPMPRRQEPVGDDRPRWRHGIPNPTDQR